MTDKKKKVEEILKNYRASKAQEKKFSISNIVNAANKVKAGIVGVPKTVPTAIAKGLYKTVAYGAKKFWKAPRWVKAAIIVPATVFGVPAVVENQTGLKMTEVFNRAVDHAQYGMGRQPQFTHQVNSDQAYYRINKFGNVTITADNQVVHDRHSIENGVCVSVSSFRSDENVNRAVIQVPNAEGSLNHYYIADYFLTPITDPSVCRNSIDSLQLSSNFNGASSHSLSQQQAAATVGTSKINTVQARKL